MKQALIIFAKAPIAGLAKTRLIPALGQQGAADLQRELLNRVLARNLSTTEWDTYLWCTPDLKHPAFVEAQLRYPLSLRQQIEGDLGHKMYSAFEQVLETYDSAVIVGTDCPAMQAARVRQAFAALRQGTDFVINPAEDGGYVLLGLRHAEAKLFSDISWGESSVCEISLQRARDNALSIEILDELWDLDESEDLTRYEQLLSEESGLGDGMARTGT